MKYYLWGHSLCGTFPHSCYCNSEAFFLFWCLWCRFMAVCRGLGKASVPEQEQAIGRRLASPSWLPELLPLCFLGEKRWMATRVRKNKAMPSPKHRDWSRRLPCITGWQWWREIGACCYPTVISGFWVVSSGFVVPEARQSPWIYPNFSEVRGGPILMYIGRLN